jgi:hypothetical protein
MWDGASADSTDDSLVACSAGPSAVSRAVSRAARWAGPTVALSGACSVVDSAGLSAVLMVGPSDAGLVGSWGEPPVAARAALSAAASADAWVSTRAATWADLRAAMWAAASADSTDGPLAAGSAGPSAVSTAVSRAARSAGPTAGMSGACSADVWAVTKDVLWAAHLVAAISFEKVEQLAAVMAGWSGAD